MYGRIIAERDRQRKLANLKIGDKFPLAPFGTDGKKEQQLEEKEEYGKTAEKVARKVGMSPS
jgi:hypothetical protein